MPGHLLPDCHPNNQSYSHVPDVSGRVRPHLCNRNGVLGDGKLSFWRTFGRIKTGGMAASNSTIQWNGHSPLFPPNFSPFVVRSIMYLSPSCKSQNAGHQQAQLFTIPVKNANPHPVIIERKKNPIPLRSLSPLKTFSFKSSPIQPNGGTEPPPFPPKLFSFCRPSIMYLSPVKKKSRPGHNPGHQ